jgi:hypothetical protein
LRLRFDARELELLRGAEQLRGAAIARSSGREDLRAALQLAKAGQKLGRSAPGGTVSLDEGEVELLVDALRFSARELSGRSEGTGERSAAVVAAFPELQENSWRSFGVARELEAVAARLAAALNG